MNEKMSSDFRSNINYRLLDALHQVFQTAANRANGRIGTTQNERFSRTCKDGGYKCIHLNPVTFCEAIQAVLNHKKIDPQQASKITFIDIGCGVGEKIFLASLFNVTTFGLELRPQLISAGRALFKYIGQNTTRHALDGSYQSTNCFIEGNALTYDYNAFDILYFYCPLVDETLQRQLEDQIIKTAKPGAVCIPMLAKGPFCCNQKIKGWQLNVPNGHGSMFYTKD